MIIREPKRWAAFADGAGKVFMGIRAFVGQGKVVIEVPVGGLGVDGKAGVLRNGQRDVAVAVLDGDIA